jgi:hypothetical protein
VIHELGLALLEGECKYWRHNYRAVKVLAMVYIEAHDRHVSAWVEGQEIDPASGLSHLVKAMACLAIVRDAQLYGSLIDDRPPAQADPNWIEELNAKAAEIIDRCAEYERGTFTEANRAEWPSFNERLSKGPIKVIGRKPVGCAPWAEVKAKRQENKLMRIPPEEYGAEWIGEPPPELPNYMKENF